MLQWGVSTSLKYHWWAVEVVEVDTMEAMPPWLALRWSGPLYTLHSHGLFLVAHLSPSSTQQLEGTVKNLHLGASLVAQRLRIRLPMLGTRVRALVWEDPTCHRATKPLLHNY